MAFSNTIDIDDRVSTYTDIISLLLKYCMFEDEKEMIYFTLELRI